MKKKLIFSLVLIMGFMLSTTISKSYAIDYSPFSYNAKDWKLMISKWGPGYYFVSIEGKLECKTDEDCNSLKGDAFSIDAFYGRRHEDVIDLKDRTLLTEILPLERKIRIFTGRYSLHETARPGLNFVLKYKISDVYDALSPRISIRDAVNLDDFFINVFWGLKWEMEVRPVEDRYEISFFAFKIRPDADPQKISFWKFSEERGRFVRVKIENVRILFDEQKNKHVLAFETGPILLSRDSKFMVAYQLGDSLYVPSQMLRPCQIITGDLPAFCVPIVEPKIELFQRGSLL